MGKPSQEVKDDASDNGWGIDFDTDEELEDRCPGRKEKYLGGGLYISYCALCIDRDGDYLLCEEGECPLIYLKKFMEK